MFFSVPSNRYRQSQNFPPHGWTTRHRPPLSANLYFFSLGFAFSISLIVSGMGRLSKVGIYFPHTFANPTPHLSPQIGRAVFAPARTFSDENSWRIPKHNSHKPFICIGLR